MAPHVASRSRGRHSQNGAAVTFDDSVRVQDYRGCQSGLSGAVARAHSRFEPQAGVRQTSWCAAWRRGEHQRSCTIRSALKRIAPAPALPRPSAAADPRPSSSLTIAARHRRRDRAVQPGMPVSPSTTTSGMPPARVATIGLPHAMASSSDVRGLGDRAHAKMSNALCSESTSGRNPASSTCFSRCCSLILPLERRPQFALAGDDEPRVRHLRQHQQAASIRWRWPLCGTSAATLPTMGAGEAARTPRAGRRAAHARRARDRCLRGRSTARAAGTPSATSILRIASGRADEAVDLTVLPPRQRVAAKMEIHAPRRDEWRLGELRAHRQRERRHRDAVRIVGVNDVGLELLDDARQPPRRRQVHLGLGASGTRSSPSVAR